MNNDQDQDRGEFAPCPLPDREQRIQDGDLMNVMRQDVIDMEAFVGSGKPVVLPFRPDWNTEAVLVEEMQCMAKRIEDLEAMLTAQTARIVDLQTQIENLEGEE